MRACWTDSPRPSVTSGPHTVGGQGDKALLAERPVWQRDEVFQESVKMAGGQSRSGQG